MDMQPDCISDSMLPLSHISLFSTLLPGRLLRVSEAVCDVAKGVESDT